MTVGPIQGYFLSTQFGRAIFSRCCDGWHDVLEPRLSSCFVWHCFFHCISIVSSDFKMFVNGSHPILPPVVAIGQLMINVSGVIGKIGAAHWEDRDAQVACRNLGYVTGIRYIHAPSTPGVPYWTNNVRCSGTETDFYQCIKDGLFSASGCNTTTEAGIICLPDPRSESHTGDSFFNVEM